MLATAIEHYAFWEIFLHPWFWAGLGGWIIASCIKMMIAAVQTKKFDFEYLVSTGGMPSSHSATVSALATAIGFTEGFGTPLATLAVCVAIITMLHASTVRRAAGEHARVLNAIIQDIKAAQLKPFKRLKELLGHTPIEVFGGCATGIIWATLLCYLWR